MDNAVAVNDFSFKFQKLNEQNQKYILAIEQAMLFAQDQEKKTKERRGQKTDEQ